MCSNKGKATPGYSIGSWPKHPATANLTTLDMG